ncbi:MAG TPA: hypothetical protein DCY13_22140 [Verrucomicrobiales bacterium]|nr:hypothetical protein [Verrucomicrobiales bacterium]
MIKYVKTMLASAALVAGLSTGSAVTIYDVNVHTEYLAAGETETGMFDISPPYNPATQTVVSASVWFFFSDDVNPWYDPLDPFGSHSEYVEIRLGPGSGVVLGTGEVGIFDIESGNVSGTAYVQLNSTGQLSYSVTATSGDFVFLAAKLAAHVGSNASVPDGGLTVGLLGLGLIAVGCWRRQKHP